MAAAIHKPSTGCVVDQAANSYWESRLQKGGAVTFPLGVRPPPGTLGAAVRSRQQLLIIQTRHLKERAAAGAMQQGASAPLGLIGYYFKC